MRWDITEKIANNESVFLSPQNERIWWRWTSPCIFLAPNQKLSAFREGNQKNKEGHNWNNSFQRSHWFKHTLKVLITTDYQENEGEIRVGVGSFIELGLVWNSTRLLIGSEYTRPFMSATCKIHNCRITSLFTWKQINYYLVSSKLLILLKIPFTFWHIFGLLH